MRYTQEIHAKPLPHRLLWVLLIATLLCGPAVTTWAYSIPDDPPKKFEDIEQVIKTEIPQDLQSAQCGGWDTGVSVMGNGSADTQLISMVSGAPGRAGEPLGNPLSGLAKRIEQGGEKNDGYDFPKNAQGKTTVCKPGNTKEQTTVSVWQDGANDEEGGKYVQQTVSYPKFEDPVCNWDEGGKHDDRPMTPDTCKHTCDWLNSYTYGDCKQFQKLTKKDDQGNDVFVGYKCSEWGRKYTCSNDWAPDGGGEGANPNCRQQCTGPTCRCPGGAACQAVGVQAKPQNPGDETTPPDAGLTAKVYDAFFRRYSVRTQRGGIPEVQNDALKDVNSEAACYGFYQEFDPKTQPVLNRRMCVINFGMGNNEYKQENLVKSQEGKGEYSPSSPPTDLPWTKRAPDVDKDKDLWYPNLGGAMSFLQETPFKDTFKKDLSAVFLQPDKAKVTAAYQYTKADPYQPNSLNRGPDDTVANERLDAQTMVQWWNEFETDMQRLISPPSVRLRLPSTLTWMLQELPQTQASQNQLPYDQLPDALKSVTATGAYRYRSQSVDVQLQARDDLLGIIQSVLQKSLLVHMEPVPVVIPDGTPDQFRALAQRWKDYKLQRGEGNYPASVDDVIQRYQDYADQVESYRALRAELPRAISKLLEKQGELLVGIQDWTNQNLEKYREFLKVRDQRLKLTKEVASIRQAYSDFQSKDNQPWCRLDTFTTPIYSLLDPWLPGRLSAPSALTGGTPDCNETGGMPILCLPKDRDLVLDLTNLRMQLSDLSMPVPTPVPVQLQLPTPPPVDGPPPTDSELDLPNLPPVPAFSDDILDRFPSVERVAPDPRVLDSTDPFDATGAKLQLKRAETLVKGMDAAYKNVWASIEPSDKNKNLECEGWSRGPCSFVETELMQIFTRITAMPLVYVKEHRTLLETKRTLATCWPGEKSCLEPTPSRLFPRDGWQVVAPPAAGTQKTMLQDLRTNAREQTIGPDGHYTQDDEGLITPYATKPDDLYPVFDIPRTEPLTRSP